MASYNCGPDVLSRNWNDWPTETKRYLEKVISIYPKYMGQRWKHYTPPIVYKASEYFDAPD